MFLIYLSPPLFGILIGFIVVTLIGKFFSKKFHGIDDAQLQEDLRDLIDIHVEDLVDSFGRQIPMSSMFLTGSLAGKLKVQAKEEILKMTPGLKKKLGERIAQKIKKDHLILKVSLLGALIGFSIGLIQSLLLFWFG